MLLPSFIKLIGTHGCFSQVTNQVLHRQFLRSVKTKSTIPYPELHLVGQSAASMPGISKIYDKKPFKFKVEKGKSYLWCSCGHSKTQPFCDGTHKAQELRIELRPVRLIAKETAEYWFCNCKRTSKRPFCDGTHRNPDIQAAIRV